MKSLNKKGLKNLTFALLSVSFLLINSTFSQCTFNNTNVSTVTLPGCPGSASVTCLHAGESVGVNVTAGNIYTFSTCGSTTFDSELTLYNTAGVTMLGYNDDFCGTQSQIPVLAPQFSRLSDQPIANCAAVYSANCSHPLTPFAFSN